jgi:hypothetical protein
MSRSVLPDLLAALEPWLEARIQEWSAQPAGARVPSLPEAKGKANVRGIVKALGLPASNAQHFFRSPELRSAVNAVALEQGLLPVGAFAENEDASEADKAVIARLKQAQTRNNDLGKAVAEQAATIERLRRENTGLREQLRMLEETGQVVRTGDLR